MRGNIGREERIRTSGPCVPNAVLYQAELLPDPFAFPRAKDVLNVYMPEGLAVQGFGPCPRRKSVSKLVSIWIESYQAG